MPVALVDTFKATRPFSGLRLRVDMLDGNFVFFGLQQVTPIDLFVPTLRQQAKFVFVEKIPKTRPAVIAAFVRKLLEEAIVKITVPQSAIFVERVGQVFIELFRD